MVQLCRRNHNLEIAPIFFLNSDIIACILEFLGLHATNLRQTCKTFVNLRLPEGVALALKILQVGPSIPLALHAPRRTTHACTLDVWDYYKYHASLVWRLEWALALKDIDVAPIHVLIDAFLATPPGESSVFGNVWVGKFYKPPMNDVKMTSKFVDRVQGSDLTSHARIALFKAIEARVWDLIWGSDLKRPMSEEEVVEVMKRIFKYTPVTNDRCFHHTGRGFLKYTPLLLAAEKHNLPLVKYLMRRRDTDTLTQSINGKNAHEICSLSLKRRGFYEDEIANSIVLQQLKKGGVRTRA